MKVERKIRMLIIDPDDIAAQRLRGVLEEAHYEVLHAKGGREGLRLFFMRRPELVILEVRTAEPSGWEVCKRVREISLVPIIIFSSQDREEDKALGLASGADDYVSKQVGSLEFLARVAAALRRARMPSLGELSDSYCDGVLTIDRNRREVYVRGERKCLSPLEYRLLTCLVESGQRILTKDELIDRVWGEGNGSWEGVKLRVSSLRRKLGENSSTPKLIVNVRGVGYRYQSDGSLATVLFPVGKPGSSRQDLGHQPALRKRRNGGREIGRGRERP